MEVKTVNAANDPAHESLHLMSGPKSYAYLLEVPGILIDLPMRYPASMETCLAEMDLKVLAECLGLKQGDRKSTRRRTFIPLFIRQNPSRVDHAPVYAGPGRKPA